MWRPRTGFLPIVLTFVAVLLIEVGNGLVQNAGARYDSALAHDCLGSACNTLGPLNHQPEYLEGIISASVGVLVAAIAFVVQARRMGWIGGGPKPDS